MDRAPPRLGLLELDVGGRKEKEEQRWDEISSGPLQQ